LGVEVGDFRVVVGSNGSGKTTLLDIPVLLGELLQASNVASTFLDRRSVSGARATALKELVFAGRGNDFSFAVEARLPEEIRSKLLEGMYLRARSESTRLALQKDHRRWPSHIRYEIGLRVSEEQELQVTNEYLFTYPEAYGPDRRQGGFQGVIAGEQKHWRTVLSREFGHEVQFKSEVSEGSGKQRATSVGLPLTLASLARVLYESEAEYPAARWFYGLLTKQSIFFEPDYSALRQASPPGLPKAITSDGRNIPWLALELKRSGAPDEGNSYSSDRFNDWVDHVRIALPQIQSIDIREREDDHHAYFVVHYRGGFSVTSSGLSDGTLRILSLTLLAYYPSHPDMLVTEEPENGIHPRAIEAVMQSLSSVYGSQVWVSSHSPVVLARTKLNNLLCGRQIREGGVAMVAGPDHPQLRDWQGGVDLGSLFAAGVLG
jgi:predicted ATPase